MKISRHTIPPHNAGLAYIFNRMADCYRFLGAEHRFRAIAYENAATILLNMPEDIAEHAESIASLDALKGIGRSMGAKIIEYLRSGRIAKFEQLKKQVPYALLELMSIPGVGPSTVRQLYTALNVRNREELAEALRQQKLQGLPGFGPKKITLLEQALKLETVKQRIPLGKARKIADALLKRILALPGVQKAEIAGSIRRKKETIGDIDILLQAGSKDRKSIVAGITGLPAIKKIIAAGTTKVTVLLHTGDIQADIRLVHDYEYGAALLYFTGSKEHNIRLRTLAREKGYKINEYGLFEVSTGRRIAGTTEKEMYTRLGLPYFPPEKRKGEGEIEKLLERNVQ